MLVFTLISALDHHPLARRVLAGLEPEVTERVLEIPALGEMRRACAERIRHEQEAGVARPDIDPVSIGNGMVSNVLSLLMSVVPVGQSAALTYRPQVDGHGRASWRERGVQYVE